MTSQETSRKGATRRLTCGYADVLCSQSILGAVRDGATAGSTEHLDVCGELCAANPDAGNCEDASLREPHCL